MKKVLSLLFVFAVMLSFVIPVSANEYLDKSTFEVKVSSLYHESDVAFITDGDVSTYWHSSYTAEEGQITGKDDPPFYIYIKFPTEQIISGFTYTPRVDNTNGTARTYNFYASPDGETAYLIDSGEGIEDRTAFTKTFGKSYKAKGVIFEMTSAVGGFGTCAEFDIIKGQGSTTKLSGGISVSMNGRTASADAPAEKPAVSEKPATGNTTATKADYLDKALLNVSASSLYEKSDFKLMNDGDVSTYWHSSYTAEGGQITGKDDPPFYIYVEFPTEQIISGFTYTPRVDNTNGTARTYNFYASPDGKTAYLIDSGEGIEDRTAFTKTFGKNYKAKGVIFEMTSAVGDFGTCAEFDLIKGSGSVTEIPKGTSIEMKGSGANSGSGTSASEDFINRDGWKINVNSVRETSPVELMTDGDNATYWHSDYTNEGKVITWHENPPYNITVELPAAEYISGLSYTSRQDENTGRFLKYKVYVADSADGEKYLVTEGEFADSAAPKFVDFAMNIKAKAVILEATATAGGYGTCAEINLSGKNDKYKSAESAREYEDAVADLRPYKVNTEGFVVKANSTWSDAEKESLAFDGLNNTIWHSHPDDRGKVFTIDVDMGKEHTLKGFDYVSRGNDEVGFLFKFSVMGSVDGVNYFDLYGKDIELPESEIARGKVFHFDFPPNADARFVKFTIKDCFLKHASVSELVLYETKESHEKAAIKNVEKYVLAIGKNEIATDINGENKTINLDVAPFIDNGRTMIPLRGLLEAMGASIEWQGDTRTIVVTKDKNVITLQIANNLVYVYKYFGGEYKTIRYTLDVPPKIKDSRTFIPVRFVTEHLGYNVGWNGETKEITIESK